MFDAKEVLLSNGTDLDSTIDFLLNDKQINPKNKLWIYKVNLSNLSQFTANEYTNIPVTDLVKLSPGYASYSPIKIDNNVNGVVAGCGLNILARFHFHVYIVPNFSAEQDEKQIIKYRLYSAMDYNGIDTSRTNWVGSGPTDLVVNNYGISQEKNVEYAYTYIEELNNFATPDDGRDTLLNFKLYTSNATNLSIDKSWCILYVFSKYE